ncbi:MAG: hypothetical protein AAF939_22025 [Planctomycetota bacterium]
MKKSAYLITLVTLLQIILGGRYSSAQIQQQDRKSVEEALDQAGSELSHELELLFSQLAESSEKMEQVLESWAQQNADKIEMWQERYGDQWDRWANQMANRLERLSDRQEDVWSQWAQDFESELSLWAEDLEKNGEGLTADQFQNLVARNIRTFSRIPAGQLVDELMEQGVGGLADAPWDSLGELDVLAEQSIAEPLAELEIELSNLLQPDGHAAEAMGQSGRRMIRTLDQLRKDVERTISDDESSVSKTTESDLETSEKSNPAIRSLKDLLDSGDISEDQKDRIRNAISVLRNGDLKKAEVQKTEKKLEEVSPRQDGIRSKIRQEKQRRLLDEFNVDLKKSSEQSRKEQLQKEQKQLRWKVEAKDSKRVDGRKQDANPTSRKNTTTDPLNFFRNGREPRKSENGSKSKHRKSDSKGSGGQPNRASRNDELQELKKEIAELKQIIKKLMDDQ